MDEQTKQEIRDSEHVALSTEYLMVSSGKVRATFDLPKQPTEIAICACGAEYNQDEMALPRVVCPNCGDPWEDLRTFTILVVEACGCRYRECRCECRVCPTNGVVFDYCKMHEHAKNLLEALADIADKAKRAFGGQWSGSLAQEIESIARQAIALAAG